MLLLPAIFLPEADLDDITKRQGCANDYWKSLPLSMNPADQGAHRQGIFNQ